MPAFRTPFESSTNACVHAEVPSRRPQSLPLGHHFGARQSHQSHAAAASTDTTYTSVVEACQNLTVASFTKAGYGLRNVTFPGSRWRRVP